VICKRAFRQRSANGNELTLARERQAKQSCAITVRVSGDPGLVTGLAAAVAFFATCILRLELPFTRRHRADKMTEVATTEPMTTGSNNCLRDANHTIEDSAVETTPDAEAAALPRTSLLPRRANAGDATSRLTHGASKSPLGWSGIARGASPGVRGIHR